MALNLKPFALVAFALAVTTSAQAVESKRGNADLKKYCTGDYLRFCAEFSADDPATDACFKRNFAKISENCRRAINFYAPSSKKGDR